MRRCVAPFGTFMVVALLLAACSAEQPPSIGPTRPAFTHLRNQPPGTVCLEALTVGSLVADDLSGVALASSGGPHLQLVWPSGWTDGLDQGLLAVADADGNLVAHVGDRVELGGGLQGPNPRVWYVCPAQGGVRVTNAGSASSVP